MCFGVRSGPELVFDAAVPGLAGRRGLPTACQIKLPTGARVVCNRLLPARIPARLFTKVTREARASDYSCSNREALPSFSTWLLHNWALGEFSNLKGVRSNYGPRLPIKGHRVLFYPFESDRAGQLERSQPLTRRGVTFRKGRFSFPIRPRETLLFVCPLCGTDTHRPSCRFARVRNRAGGAPKLRCRYK